MPPAISIITVYFNNPDDMRRLDASMRSHLNPDDYEWIVSDNASDQSMKDELKGALYLKMEKNAGFGAGCNRAAEKASAPVLFFVNPDCEFIQDCTQPLLNALKTSAIAGPCVLYSDGACQLSFGPFLSITAEARQKFIARYERSRSIQNWLKHKGIAPVDYVSGCALMIHAGVFRKLNGFDEHFFLYNEDVDLCKRVRQNSMEVMYVPEARIVHTKSSSAVSVQDRKQKEYRKSQRYYYRKHHGFLQNALLTAYLRLRGLAVE